MGALVGKGKSALGTEPLHVAGANEALVQDNLIILTFTPLHSSAQETARTESFCAQT